MIGSNIISRRAALTWLPRSPDLNVPDYNLWGYQKERVYIDRPENLEELKDNIRRKISAISPATLHSVMTNALVSNTKEYYLPELVYMQISRISFRWM